MPDTRRSLVNNYGEENTRRVYALAEQIRHDYPHLSVNQKGLDRFAEGIFQLCERSVAVAASDRRTHSITATISICEKHLPHSLTSGTYELDSKHYMYGDENDRANQKARETWETIKGLFWVGGFLVCAFLILRAIFIG